MKNILVVCAHPGDEILGCGGTLALHAGRGDKVHVAVLGDGWTSRVKSPEKGLEVLDLDVLEKQGRAALTTLGIEEVEYFRFPDNRFDSVAMLDLVKVVERIKGHFMPDVVFTNSTHDLNIDQQKTCRAVVTAFRPQPGEKFTELYAFEALSSTEWNQADTPKNFNPNVFVNIEATLGMKLDAFRHLTSEVRPWPHARSLDSIEYHAKSRGASVGVGAAEAFMLLRAVRNIK